MILDWNFHLSLLEYLDYLLPFALFYFFIRALLQGQKLGVGGVVDYLGTRA